MKTRIYWWFRFEKRYFKRKVRFSHIFLNKSIHIISQIIQFFSYRYQKQTSSNVDLFLIIISELKITVCDIYYFHIWFFSDLLK
jgi:hypothetical protein